MNLTEEQIREMMEHLEKEYGDNLPDPEHCPREFAHIVKMYLYYRGEHVSN